MNATHKYRTQQIMTASPAQLVALAYEQAISALNEAVEAIKAGDVQGRWRANKRASDLITELAVTLDLEQGGEIAQNLFELYRYALARLPQVDLANDPQPAEEAIRLLTPLRDSWRRLVASGADLPAPSETKAAAAAYAPKTAPAPAAQPVPEAAGANIKISA